MVRILSALFASASMWRSPIPKLTHIVLHQSAVLPRVVIVGDIHGCLTEFQDLLMKCNYKKEDTTLILVGDLVNKGPYSAEVIKYARELNAYCVRGNHDDSMLSHAFNMNPNPRPESYGYIDSLSEEDLEWMKDLPYTISIPSLQSMVVHAGIVPDKPLEDQDFFDMHSMRNLISQEDGSTKASTKITEGVPWAAEWKGPTHIYFGHDARRGLQLHPFTTGLDTGCCYGRKLSAVILPSKEIVQVDAREAYAPVTGDA